MLQPVARAWLELARAFFILLYFFSILQPVVGQSNSKYAFLKGIYLKRQLFSLTYNMHFLCVFGNFLMALKTH